MTPDDLLQIYCMGCFPMAESGDDPDFSIVEPVKRALLPIRNLHIPKRLKRTVLQTPFGVSVDKDFSGVMRACATAREDTWINPAIEELFASLHEAGYAHSVECWKDGELVGGLYGLAMGGTFCGESMFSLETDASKVALVHLCARLDYGGFSQLDAQFRNPHLDQFGLYEIPQEDYLVRLRQHLADRCDYVCAGKTEPELLERFFNERLVSRSSDAKEN